MRRAHAFAGKSMYWEQFRDRGSLEGGSPGTVDLTAVMLLNYNLVFHILTEQEVVSLQSVFLEK